MGYGRRGLPSTVLLERQIQSPRDAIATRSNCDGVVAIMARTDAGEVVLVEQFRPPVACRVIEFPAGLVGDHGSEDVLVAAARELEEETGFHARRLRSLWTGANSAGLTDETTTMVVAEGLEQRHAGGGVGSEDIVVHLVPLDQLEEWLSECEGRGLIVDLKVRLALLALGGK